MIKLVWVPGHIGIDGNEIADELARQDSSNPLTGPEPVLSMSAVPVW
jgi:ribonuclease HI